MNPENSGGPYGHYTLGIIVVMFLVLIAAFVSAAEVSANTDHCPEGYELGDFIKHKDGTEAVISYCGKSGERHGVYVSFGDRESQFWPNVVLDLSI